MLQNPLTLLARFCPSWGNKCSHLPNFPFSTEESNLAVVSDTPSQTPLRHWEKRSCDGINHSLPNSIRNWDELSTQFFHHSSLLGSSQKTRTRLGSWCKERMNHCGISLMKFYKEVTFVPGLYWKVNFYLVCESIRIGTRFHTSLEKPPSLAMTKFQRRATKCVNLENSLDKGSDGRNQSKKDGHYDRTCHDKNNFGRR